MSLHPLLEVNNMVKFYVLQIKAGKKKLEDVPVKWRDLVEKELYKENEA